MIVGLTVLAYRYSGLRKTDFVNIVDGLTSDFSHEIGPSRERPSSRRHEEWVNESGGSLRGLKKTPEFEVLAKGLSEEEMDTREVVQLKYLQKSNVEQMQKLYKLWALEPHVLHFYLNQFIYPTYMRNQKAKISASGQAIGGDMLFGKRVGFSGTPSDLLPKELGKCDYETGDDGKMLSTVLDASVASFTCLDTDWNVEILLDTIAQSASPRFHALIDTGALITGYSNQEVAEQLLNRGLDWCDGVVFLDENDKQNVLVKESGRVVFADQCGIPLERRFAFYDQIHTTGMDIQHVVNATAVITLGKDMVFRDYVQGAYRMRGIGQGQRINVFIIPEVLELMQRQLRVADMEAQAVPTDVHKTLVEVVAWLVINSMRSEQTQWSMLCLQNLANVYRKNAFNQVQAMTHAESEGRVVASSSAQEVFNEAIDFALEATVPDPVPFGVKLQDHGG